MANPYYKQELKDKLQKQAEDIQASNMKTWKVMQTEREAKAAADAVRLKQERARPSAEQQYLDESERKTLLEKVKDKVKGK